MENDFKTVLCNWIPTSLKMPEIQKDWICNCGTYVIFSEKCPRCNKLKSTFVKNINNHENK